LFSRADVDGQYMELTRDEARLAEIRSKLALLSIVSTDNFNLPARHRSLVTLEAILLRRVTDARGSGRTVSNGSRLR
jgi:hypothetical protein